MDFVEFIIEHERYRISCLTVTPRDRRCIGIAAGQRPVTEEYCRSRQATPAKLAVVAFQRGGASWRLFPTAYPQMQDSCRGSPTPVANPHYCKRCVRQAVLLNACLAN